MTLWFLRVQIRGSLLETIRDERKHGLIVKLSCEDTTFNSVLFRISNAFFNEMKPLRLFDTQGMELKTICDLRNDLAVFAYDKNDQSINEDNSLVVLNVGGKEFTTTKKTLLSYPNSSLATLESRSFIDRPARLFEVILDYLRTKNLSLPTDIDENDLYNEAKYFKLDNLCADLDRHRESKKSSLTTEMIIKTVLDQQRQVLLLGQNLKNIERCVASIVALVDEKVSNYTSHNTDECKILI